EHKKSVGLVLSGGGARGIAHIGVLQVLEKLNIKIDYIGGTSFGALVAAFYAAGYSPNEIERIIKDFNWDSAFEKKQERQQYYYYTRQEIEANLMRFRFTNWSLKIPSSIANSQNILNKLLVYFTRANYISEGNFFDLNPPLLISTTNIINGENRIFEKGNLIKVIQASLSVPLLFPPVEMDSSLYVDGGISNNLPINAMKNMGADLIIASNTSHFLTAKKDMNSVLSIADQLINIMMFTKVESELSNADIIIRPEVENIPNNDFSRIDELIMAGRRATFKDSSALNKLFFIPEQVSNDKTIPFKYDHSQIILLGNTIFPDSILFENISKIHTLDEVNNLAANIRNTYEKSGYILTKIDSIEYSFDSISFFINEGLIQSVGISGNEITKPRFIFSEIPSCSGEIFNINKVIRGVKGIYSTNLFESVSYETQTNRDGNVELTYIVEEKAYGIIEAGLNYNSEQNTSAFVSIGDENILGTGNAIKAFARFGNERKFGIDFRDDRILDTNFNSHFKLYFKDDIDIDGDREWNFILDSGFFDKEKFGLFSLIFDYKQSNLKGQERTVGIGAELVFDDYDRFPYPRKGINREFSYKNFNKVFGSKFDFQNFKFINRIYFTPIKGVSFSEWINLDLNNTTTGDVPFNRIITHRLPNTFFGYHYEDVFGEDLFYISSQIRILLKKFTMSDPRHALYLIAKVGIGRFGEINSMNQFWNTFTKGQSIGFTLGIEMPTILGPIKLFYEESKKISFWNLSIGYEF
ncbi:MAG: patatin-like phospholipase family protein, partial [Candidatus Cloacimonadota bacterium]|nr:patatin-like phospholipase family protein [Candidatus Cloacimonadota bacterium]